MTSLYFELFIFRSFLMVSSIHIQILLVLAHLNSVCMCAFMYVCVHWLWINSGDELLKEDYSYYRLSKSPLLCNCLSFVLSIPWIHSIGLTVSCYLDF